MICLRWYGFMLHYIVIKQHFMFVYILHFWQRYFFFEYILIWMTHKRQFGRPGLSQEPRNSTLFCLTCGRVPDSGFSICCLPGTLAGSWIGTMWLGLESGTTMWDWASWWLNVLCHNSCPWKVLNFKALFRMSMLGKKNGKSLSDCTN